ncbi:glycosyltransferase family 2 protein [Inhella gelatinilytica]|uniref:Glycosyltransferase family 2 protein n=1 Tax=Inhella gelatinilytica TaxID=2795030 RepID=A0A931NF57_9BURK|nr:glycosyltransferase family 2 protein [Inhella gelatinilytica]MBH9553176.1 glycosyltransferase family 2 protein [Inhella gelatinilytica]
MTRLTILMPCLNEAETLGACIQKAQRWIAHRGIEAEVLVADNGSTDGSQAIAESLGARVLPVPRRGYGAALNAGAMGARGEFIIMGDSDDSYDFSQLDAFVDRLEAGDDLVMGNRFKGGIAPGAMPWKNRYIGNPVLSWIGRLLFKCPVRDFHCGLRGFRRDAFLRMGLRTTGMEFASEMVIKATLLKMRISEVPTTLSPDGRSRPPHLRPWRDGWRHLRFMLLFSPRWLFWLPGLALLVGSSALYVPLLMGPLQLGHVALDVHTLMYAQAGLLLGTSAMSFGLLVRMVGAREGLLEDRQLLRWLRESPALEVGGLLGLGLIGAGLYWGLSSVWAWGSSGYGQLPPASLMREVSAAVTLGSLGGLGLLTSLVVGFLSLPTAESSL